ncbi:MAG: hypothetical protein ABIH34_03005 [Nanoarchaeota archaeon]
MVDTMPLPHYLAKTANSVLNEGLALVGLYNYEQEFPFDAVAKDLTDHLDNMGIHTRSPEVIAQPGFTQSGENPATIREALLNALYGVDSPIYNVVREAQARYASLRRHGKGKEEALEAVQSYLQPVIGTENPDEFMESPVWKEIEGRVLNRLKAVQTKENMLDRCLWPR